MREVATFEPHAVSVEDELYDAMLLMLRHRVHRLVVRDGEAVVGVLSQLDLMAFVASHSHLIALQAAQAADVAELGAAARQIDGLIRVLHADGVRVEVIAGLVGELNRQVLQRLWQLLAPEALRANACLIVMGSEGRGEQIVKTDQDNALILRDGFAAERLEAVTEAFTAALIDFGYPPCPGGIMLSRPLWRQPLAGFRDTLRQWIHGPDPDGPMNLAIFLDAAAVAGDAALLAAARDHVDRLLSGSDAFHARFAGAVLTFAEGRLVVAAARAARPRGGGDRPQEARDFPDRARGAGAGPAIPGARARHRRAAAGAGGGRADRRGAGARPDRRGALPDRAEARDQPAADGRRAHPGQQHPAERARHPGAAGAEGLARHRPPVQAVARPALPARRAVRPRRDDGGPRRELLLALSGAGLVLFNFPMLIVWDQNLTVLGLPLLPVALFAIWAGLIAALAWASERRPTRPGAPGQHEESESPPTRPGAAERDVSPRWSSASPSATCSCSSPSPPSPTGARRRAAR